MSADIELSYDIPLPVEQAWLAWVNDLATWWPVGYLPAHSPLTGLMIEPRVGGAVVGTEADGGQQDWGRVLAFTPFRVLEHTFALRHTEASQSVLSMHFTDSDIGTRLTFAHRGWSPDNLDDREQFADWPAVLAGYVRHSRSLRSRQSLSR